MLTLRLRKDFYNASEKDSKYNSGIRNSENERGLTPRLLKGNASRHRAIGDQVSTTLRKKTVSATAA